MRVLQLGKFHPIKGGVEKVMYSFMLGLGQREIHCDMLCASDDGDVGTVQLTPYCTLYKVRTLMTKSATMIAPDMISTLRRICHSYDIIHIHHPDPMATLALFLSGYKGKVALHWHSDILKQKVLLQLYRPLQSWLIKRSDIILGTTPVYVEQSPHLQHVKHKLGYLPIGVRERTAEPHLIDNIRRQYEGRRIIYSMGRLVAYKGYEFLIEAARYLSDDYIILIGGKGPLKQELQQLIYNLNLNSRVKILGYIPTELEGAYYGASDVFCLSSTIRTEAYAIVQVEAMSAGKPVVACNIPGSGVSWVNAHGVSGLNVEICNGQALAEAIKEICSDERTYNRYCLGAHMRYKQLFTRDAMIDGLVQIYQDLLPNGKALSSDTTTPPGYTISAIQV